MKLPKHEAKRFFELFDLVTVYAHDKLGACDDSIFWSTNSPRGISEKGQRDTVEALWNNIDILDDFLAENPAKLGFEDLAIIASWKNAYSRIFFIDKDKNGHLLFLGNEHLFDVCGLSLEIDGMLNQIPTMANTTLLPFGNYVVYGMFIAEYPVHMGEGMLNTMKNGFSDALAAGNIVRNAQEFAAVVPAAKEEEMQREIDNMLKGLELDQRADDLLEGQHAGVLAGLTQEEREQVIEAYYQSEEFIAGLGEDDSADDYSIADELNDRCIEGTVCTSLDDLLEADKEMSPKSFAEAFGALEFDDLDLNPDDEPEARKRFEVLKASLGKEATDDFFSESLKDMLCDPEKLEERFRKASIYQVNALKRLAEANGRLSIPASSDELYDAPMPQKGLCYLFKENDTFEFVMPDEVVPVVNGFDWEAWEAYIAKRIGLNRFISAATELRGICLYSDVIEEYAQLCPDSFQTAQEIHDEVERLLYSGLSDMLLLDTGNKVYLLHEDLAWLYLDGQGFDPYDSERIIEGPLDKMLDRLLEHQRGKDPRPIELGMINDNSIYRWKEGLPAAHTLRSYLDSHVPDTQNDYSFADEVLAEVDETLHWGMPNEGIKVFMEALEDHDFVPDEAQLRKLVDLFMNYANSMPTWTNNGWAPNETASKMYGQKIFYNEDRSIMKVGRNDPCPCGSGKKYKKCCGAR